MYNMDLTTSAEKSEITVLVTAALNRLQAQDRKLPQVLRVKVRTPSSPAQPSSQRGTLRLSVDCH
jgi:hypothetical protein